MALRLSAFATHSVALGGDGQVSLGDTVMKGNAVKVRKLYQDKVLAGLPAARQMHLPYSKNLRRHWRNIMAN